MTEEKSWIQYLESIGYCIEKSNDEVILHHENDIFYITLDHWNQIQSDMKNILQESFLENDKYRQWKDFENLFGGYE